MDITHAKEVLEDVQSENVEIVQTYTDIPSPFAFNLITAGYADVMKMQDKQEFLQRMHEYVLAKIGIDNDGVEPPKKS
jgi:Lhr-like helicase